MSRRAWYRKPPLSGSVADRNDPFAKNLVAHYPLNEGGGPLSKNIVNKRNITWVAAPAWAPGKFGESVVLDGTTQYGTISTGTTTMPYTGVQASAFGLSFTAWMKTPTLVAGGARHNIMGGCVNGNTDDASGGFAFVDGIAYPTLMGRIFNGGYVVTGSSPGDIGLLGNTWYFFAVVFDKGASLIRLYVNGKQAYTGTACTISGISQDPNNFYYGASPANSHVESFNGGSLGPCRIYLRSITPNEIRQLYTEPFRDVKALRHGVVGAAAAPPGGFLPYWASQRSRVIGGGVI